jgi:hypothetical protein
VAPARSGGDHHHVGPTCIHDEQRREPNPEPTEGARDGGAPDGKTADADADADSLVRLEAAT